MSNSFEPRTAPVNEGDIIEVTVEGVGEKGDGIARVQGFVIFIPTGKAGQKVTVRMVKVLSKVGFAEVVTDKAPTKKVVQNSGRPKRGAEERRPAPDVPVPDPEPSPEDSDDFGEEPDLEEYL
jgi:predicted RNA-binding protein with TRAM domain